MRARNEWVAAKRASQERNRHAYGRSQSRNAAMLARLWLASAIHYPPPEQWTKYRTASNILHGTVGEKWCERQGRRPPPAQIRRLAVIEGAEGVMLPLGGNAASSHLAAGLSRQTHWQKGKSARIWTGWARPKAQGARLSGPSSSPPAPVRHPRATTLDETPRAPRAESQTASEADSRRETVVGGPFAAAKPPSIDQSN